MPQYFYEGYDRSGKSETGSIDSGSEKLAFETLQSRGVTVIDLAPGKGRIFSDVPWYKRDIRFSDRELSDQDQAIVADLLAVLFQAKLPISEVIRIATLSAEKAGIKRHFERTGQRVAEGESFPDAFEAENRLFSPIFVSFLRVSDTTNMLPLLLKELSKFFQKQNAVKQNIASALIYPSILVCAAIALFFVIVLYLAPNLEPIFASVGRDMPTMLRFLLWLNSALREYWFLLLLGIFGSFLGTIALVQLPSIRSVASRLRYSLPMFGALSLLSILSRLVQSTQLLLSSGLPLEEALRVSGEHMARASPLRVRFAEAATAVEEGRSAAAVFDEDSRLPVAFKELFRIGEQSNSLPVTLTALSEHVSGQLERKSQQLLSFLTPTLTLILGLGIGTLVYTLMGAILEVNEIVL